MKINDLKDIEKWFENYAQSFAVDGKLPATSEMKRNHSYRVEEVGNAIVKGLGWGETERDLGTAASLLHDTGRFSQYRDFGTLSDAHSTDHGDRGYAVLLNEFPTEYADTEGRLAILEAVRWHNKKLLPDDVPARYTPYCRLVRDADKVDVFCLVQQHIDDGKVQELLPRHKIDAPLTDAVLDEIAANGRASYKNVTSLADFLILQITWLLDINYKPTMDMIDELGAVNKIEARLPITPYARNVLDGLYKRVEAHKKELR